MTGRATLFWTGSLSEPPWVAAAPAWRGWELRPFVGLRAPLCVYTGGGKGKAETGEDSGHRSHGHDAQHDHTAFTEAVLYTHGRVSESRTNKPGQMRTTPALDALIHTKVAASRS